MRRVLLLSAAALLLAAPLVRADLGPKPGARPPLKPPQIGQPPLIGQPAQPQTKIAIEVDEKATEPRLIVPMQVMLGGAGVAPPLGNPPPPPGLGNPPGGIKPPAPPEEGAALPLSTVIVGLALTLSLSTGGLWVVRRKHSTSGSSTALLLFVALTALAVAGTTALANRAAPPRPPQPPAFPGQEAVPGPLPALMKMDGVKVQIVQQGDTVRLILTKKHKDALQKEQPKKEE